MNIIYLLNILNEVKIFDRMIRWLGQKKLKILYQIFNYKIYYYHIKLVY